MFEQTKIEKNKLLFPLMVLSVWTMFGVFFGTQGYVRAAYAGKAASLPGFIIGWLICGYSWAVLTVPVLRFTSRYAVRRVGWSRFFLIHIPAAVLFTLAQLGIYVMIASVLFGKGLAGVWEFYKFTVVQEFQSSFLVYFAIVLALTARDRWVRVPAGVQVGPSVKSADSADLADLAGAQENGHTLRYVQRIPVKDNGRIILVDLDDVDWIESYGNYIFLHTPHRRHIVRETMLAMESKLDPRHFVRIRRSTIVRIERIAELRPTPNAELEVVLKNGNVLRSTRRYRKNLESIVRR